MSKKIKILIFVAGILLVLLAVLLVFRFFIQADTTGVIIKGQIFQGQGDAVSGLPAFNVTVTLIDYKGTKWDTTTKENGQYEFRIAKPACNYRVILSGGQYNAKDAGTISTASVIKNPRQTFNYQINKEVDLMWSTWFNTAWPYGYGGQYHFSKWDYHYLRNQTTLNQILNKQAPKTASFEIPFQGFPSEMVKQWGVDNVWVNFHVSPVTSDWRANGPTDVGKTVYTLNRKFTDINSEGVAKFIVNLGSLDPQTRYKSWINGFQIATSFYVADKNGTPQGSSIGDFNPDWRINRSEDNGGRAITTISYGGLEAMQNTDLFVEPVAAPLNGYRLSSDYGYRDFGQHWHEGLDFAGGSNIYAVNPGIVEYVDNNSICGVGIKIHHANNVETVYCHMAKGSRTVKNGAEVCTGTPIGTADSTGRIRKGAHLHFGIKKDGNFIDPFPYFKQFVHEVTAKYFKGWDNRNLNSTTKTN